MEGGDRAVRRTVDRTLLILTGLALAIVAIGPPAGGLAGHYGILGADGGRVPLLVDEQGDSIPRIDPAVNFPIPHRIDAVYIHHWDIARLGFPESMPS